ncbi:MAG: zinc-binding dehydrogenase [Planctomycetaceae bacterium]
MLAGLIPERGRIELIDVDEPELSPKGPKSPAGEIIFEPELACLCGSDLPFFDGDEHEYPIQVGQSLHEMIGRVVAQQGSQYHPGDRVLVVPVEHLGLFERYTVDASRAVPFTSKPNDACALLAQPLGTVIYALKKIPDLIDKDVVIVGQGPMGQLFNLAVRNLGARQIIGVDKCAARLETSKKVGATATICNSTEDPIKRVAELTGGQMADVVIEVVGHRDQALNLCIDLCRKFGRILFFGVPEPEINKVRWLDMFFKNITIHTSVHPDFKRDFPLAMRWINEGRVDVSPLITHTYPLTEIQTAFEVFRDKKDGAQKVFVEFPAYHER